MKTQDTSSVIPAQAGIQFPARRSDLDTGFAGMTDTKLGQISGAI